MDPETIVPHNVRPTLGLFGFKDISVDPHNSHVVRLRFKERVSNVHKAQILDAMHKWMLAQAKQVKDAT